MADLSFNAKATEAARLHRAGQLDAAVTIYRELEKKAPRDVQLLRFLGMALRDFGRSEEAAGVFRRAIKIAPGDPALHFELAATLRQGTDLDAAHAAVDRSLKLGPAHPGALGLKAELCFMTGDAAAGYEALRPLLEGVAGSTVHPGVALAFARIGPKVGRSAEATDLLRRFVAEARADNATKAEAFFRLGDLLDAAGEWGGAFDAFERGNALVGTLYDPTAHAAQVDRLIKAWPAGTIERLGASAGGAGGSASELPVYIVGMPRSGTSLVEQILATHPAVAGGGERGEVHRLAERLQGKFHGLACGLERVEVLTPPVIRKEAGALVDAYGRAAPRAGRFTDKMPDNFLHLGLLAVLLPRARIIHCVRDALDTGLSCYFQHFGGHYNWVYDQRHIGAYYRDYLRLMEHWKKVLRAPMLDVSYEELVADQEGQSRRMVEFIGLPWDDACMRFYENKRVVNTASNDQVRRPIYRSSSGRWRNYAGRIGPMAGEMGITIPP